MQKKKSLTQKQFKSLTSEQQTKELKSMAKRANVRLSLLEEKGVINGVYYNAQDYNFNKGKIKNRFYEGTNYRNSGEIEQAFKVLSNTLNDRQSTLGGIEKSVQDRITDLVDKGKFTVDYINTLSGQEQIYATKQASRLANKRLKELEKNNLTKYAYQHAEVYNEQTGRKNNRFYTGGKFKDDETLQEHEENVVYFLNAKTSTKKGYDQINIDRINAFREKKVNIEQGRESDFIDFLEANWFKALGGKVASNQIVNTYVDARNAGKDADEINKAFQEFLDSENMTFDEVQEKLKVAKWQNGGELLK